MAAPQRPKSAKKNKISWIPILFTVGVIGWGFLAIDRLLPDQPGGEVNALKNAGKKEKAHNESWKATLNSWFSSILGSEKKDNHQPKTKNNQNSDKSNISSMPNDEVEFDEDVISETADSGDGIIYVYQNSSNGLPKLISLPVKIKNQETSQRAKEIFVTLLEFGEKNEGKLNYFNSFPVKPILKSVKLSKDTMVLNFNESFGEGTSLQLLRFQIKQLLATARQFKQIRYIQIQVNSKLLREVGGDGIMIPEKINNENLI